MFNKFSILLAIIAALLIIPIVPILLGAPMNYFLDSVAFQVGILTPTIIFAGIFFKVKHFSIHYFQYRLRWFIELIIIVGILGLMIGFYGVYHNHEQPKTLTSGSIVEAAIDDFKFYIHEEELLYEENFEGGVTEWIIGDSDDNATSGIWEHGTPNQILSYRYNKNGAIVQPNECGSGKKCMFTGYDNGKLGDNDVDNGVTSLISPVINFRKDVINRSHNKINNSSSVFVEYSKWFSNNQGDYPGTDRFNFYVSNDAGNNWLLLGSSTKSDTVWNHVKIQLDKHVKITDKMQFKFSAEDILHEEDFSTSIHMISRINVLFFKCLLSLYYALIFSFTLYFIMKLPERFPNLLPGISREPIDVSAFENYKSIIYFVCIILATHFGLTLVGYNYKLNTYDFLFIVLLILLTIITHSISQMKILIKSLVTNKIIIDIDEIKLFIKNTQLLKRLLIFIAILIQFFGIMLFLRLLGSQPSLDPIKGFDWLSPLSKGSFYILFISFYLIIIHSLEGKLIQSAYIQKNELIQTDKSSILKFYFPLLFLSSLTFGIVSLVTLILF